MANQKISALTSATTPLDGTEEVPLVQSSTTKKVAASNFVLPDLSNTFTQAQVFAAGSVSTPSITTSGDTDTGFYFPSAGVLKAAINGAEAGGLNSVGFNTPFNFLSTVVPTQPNDKYTNRGTYYIVSSTSIGAAIDICEFTTPYAATVLNRGVGALIEITVVYMTNSTNTRTAVSVAQLRASVVRGTRAGNQMGTSVNLQLIGTAHVSDTGGGTSRIIDISNFATTITGGNGSTQTSTIAFTPPATLTTGTVYALAEVVSLGTTTDSNLSMVKL